MNSAQCGLIKVWSAVVNRHLVTTIGELLSLGGGGGGGARGRQGGGFMQYHKYPAPRREHSPCQHNVRCCLYNFWNRGIG